MATGTLRTIVVGTALGALLTWLPASTAWAQTGTIAGRVTASGVGQPVPGVQVFIPGTSFGGLTDADGRYRLAEVPAGEVQLRVEMIGYSDDARTVTVSASQVATVDFELQPDALLLDELVVTGQAGQARRREVGNAIAQIDLTQVAEPVASLENLLQGRATGVTVGFEDAALGGGAVIRLRGNVSVSQGNQPLIYIDGVRQAGDAYRRGTNQKEAGPLADINPADVARVEIIKGAAAATLYGSEAAAGVIQIFTKRGQDGGARFTYQTDQSLSWVRPWGSDARPRLDMDPWLQTAHGQRHLLSVSGGQERFRYFVSGGIDDREGVQVDDGERRYNVRSNVTVVANPQLTFDLNTMFSRDELSLGPTGNALEGIMFNIYRAPNNFVGGALPGDPEFEDQINSLRTRISETNNQRQMLGLTVNFNPTERFTNRFTAGYDRMSQDQETILPFGYPTAPDGQIDVGNWFNAAVTLDLASSYSFDPFEGLATTLSGGGQLIRREIYEFEATGLGLPGPGDHNLSSTAQRNVGSSGLRINTGGFFVQGMLGYRDRYFVTAGARVDGSSAFGQDFGLEVYPKVSASYVISDEPFWPEALGTVKLRGAYGFAGRAPGAFDAVRTWSPSSYRGLTAFSPSNVGNPVLGPERTGELEIGFDGAFLSERMTVDLTYYHQITSEGLFGVGQAPSLGFGGAQLENIGKLKNTGIELATNFTVLQRRDLALDLGVNVSTNKGEILDMGGIVDYNLVEGGPVPARRGARVVNKDEFADPIFELDYIFGPSQPTHIITGHMALQLPRGLLFTARAEYQGGHWMEDFVSWRIATQTGPGANGCDDAAYRHVPHDEYLGPGDTHPNLDQVRALDRARCYARSRDDVWFMPADFAKLREITLQAPLPFGLPLVEDATVTASISNLLRWTNSEFASQDPEARHARDQINTLQSIVSDQVPAPASFTLSFRAAFR
jgi:outer membrane receptor protein involved in Fe transport